MKKRERPLQINVIIDAEIKQAIDDIRAWTRPVPTASMAIREAIIEKRDALKRKIESQERRK